MDRPDWGILRSMVDDLQRARQNVVESQQRMLAIRGEARSDDRLIRVVVGPRGQLVDLELDPRVFRNPDSKALAAAIMATARDAIEDCQRQARELRDELLPKDLRSMAEQLKGGPDLFSAHDADLEGKKDA
jgi:DNA-binding protein YbaB